MKLRQFMWEPLIQMALAEDLGQGDVTTSATIARDRQGRFGFVARQPLVVAGMEAIVMTFERLDAAVRVHPNVAEGETVRARTVVATIEGPAVALLSGERVALNIFQRLCAIATVTRSVVESVADLPVTILDTRKTTPGWRSLEKYAVRTGGAKNHRYGLGDAVLIKDNHVAAAGGIAAAVAGVRKLVGPTTVVEVEVDRLDQIPEALAAGVDGILLDNFSTSLMRQGVEAIGHQVWVEASGGIRPERVREVAETGVDYISLGYLTHSAPAVDIGADWEV